MSKLQDNGVDVSEDTTTEEEIHLDEPKMYKVVLHNDDYTPMEFVVEVLVEVFHKDYPMATQIMLNVHNQGKGICGIFSFEIAETKINRVHELAERYEFPLKASMEEA